jgi:hypothetical protein
MWWPRERTFRPHRWMCYMVVMEMMLTFCCWRGEMARQSIDDFMLVTLPSSKDQEEDVQPTTSHASLHRQHNSATDKKHTRSSSWTQTSPYATRHMRRDMWGVLVCSWPFFVFARHGQVDMVLPKYIANFCISFDLLYFMIVSFYTRRLVGSAWGQRPWRFIYTMFGWFNCILGLYSCPSLWPYHKLH